LFVTNVHWVSRPRVRETDRVLPALPCFLFEGSGSPSPAPFLPPNAPAAVNVGLWGRFGFLHTALLGCLFGSLYGCEGLPLPGEFCLHLGGVGLSFEGFLDHGQLDFCV